MLNSVEGHGTTELRKFTVLRMDQETTSVLHASFSGHTFILVGNSWLKAFGFSEPDTLRDFCMEAFSKRFKKLYSSAQIII